MSPTVIWPCQPIQPTNVSSRPPPTSTARGSPNQHHDPCAQTTIVARRSGRERATRATLLGELWGQRRKVSGRCRARRSPGRSNRDRDRGDDQQQESRDRDPTAPGFHALNRRFAPGSVGVSPGDRPPTDHELPVHQARQLARRDSVDAFGELDRQRRVTPRRDIAEQARAQRLRAIPQLDPIDPCPRAVQPGRADGHRRGAQRAARADDHAIAHRLLVEHVHRLAAGRRRARAAGRP